MATARVYCHRVSVAGPADRQLSVGWWQLHSCGGHLSRDYRHIATYIQQRYQILYILQQGLDTVLWQSTGGQTTQSVIHVYWIRWHSTSGYHPNTSCHRICPLQTATFHETVTWKNHFPEAIVRQWTTWTAPAKNINYKNRFITTRNRRKLK